MKWKSDTKPDEEQKSRLACWCPRRTLPGCQTELLTIPDPAGDGAFAEQNTKTRFIVVKEKNEQPTCSRAGQLPPRASVTLTSNTRNLPTLTVALLLLPPSSAGRENEPDGSKQVISCLALGWKAR